MSDKLNQIVSSLNKLSTSFLIFSNYLNKFAVEEKEMSEAAKAAAAKEYLQKIAVDAERTLAAIKGESGKNIIKVAFGTYYLILGLNDLITRGVGGQQIEELLYIIKDEILGEGEEYTLYDVEENEALKPLYILYSFMVKNFPAFMSNAEDLSPFENAVNSLYPGGASESNDKLDDIEDKIEASWEARPTDFKEKLKSLSKIEFTEFQDLFVREDDDDDIHSINKDLKSIGIIDQNIQKLNAETAAGDIGALGITRSEARNTVQKITGPGGSASKLQVIIEKYAEKLKEKKASQSEVVTEFSFQLKDQIRLIEGIIHYAGKLKNALETDLVRCAKDLDEALAALQSSEFTEQYIQTPEGKIWYDSKRKQLEKASAEFARVRKFVINAPYQNFKSYKRQFEAIERSEVKADKIEFLKSSLAVLPPRDEAGERNKTFDIESLASLLKLHGDIALDREMHVRGPSRSKLMKALKGLAKYINSLSADSSRPMNALQIRTIANQIEELRKLEAKAIEEGEKARALNIATKGEVDISRQVTKELGQQGQLSDFGTMKSGIENFLRNVEGSRSKKAETTIEQVIAAFKAPGAINKLQPKLGAEFATLFEQVKYRVLFELFRRQNPDHSKKKDKELSELPQFHEFIKAGGFSFNKQDADVIKIVAAVTISGFVREVLENPIIVQELLDKQKVQKLRTEFLCMDDLSDTISKQRSTFFGKKISEKDPEAIKEKMNEIELSLNYNSAKASELVTFLQPVVDRANTELTSNRTLVGYLVTAKDAAESMVSYYKLLEEEGPSESEAIIPPTEIPAAPTEAESAVESVEREIDEVAAQKPQIDEAKDLRMLNAFSYMPKEALLKFLKSPMAESFRNSESDAVRSRFEEIRQRAMSAGK